MFLPAAMGRILFFSIDISPRSYMILTLFYRLFPRKIDIAHHNSALSMLLQIGKGVKEIFCAAAKKLGGSGAVGFADSHEKGEARDARTASGSQGAALSLSKKRSRR